ncbi:MAG TPA: hypothetical protein VEF89_06075 [Solirubrobacteraceae bacterium]|nr:hypothetical protein [Solirubrobacteraceae bacterium]
MSSGRGDTVSGLQARHEQAVARTLEWAEEAAERGQHATALEWLQTLETMGDELSSEYERKRERWRRALVGERAARERRSARRPQ